MTIEQIITCPPSNAIGQERSRYFAGLLVTADDLTQDQIYVREKLRRHNRMLHGWGVVCGARVRKGQGDCEIVIEAGYILDPCGNEIVIPSDVTVDVCKEDLNGNAAGPCGEVFDPWCSDVRMDRNPGQTLYVAVCYDECQTRPVRVMAKACGCDATECEYSRIRDSFKIKVLTKLPSTYTTPMQPPSLASALGNTYTSNSSPAMEDQCARSCPACPTECCVIVADVTLTQARKVGKIDCYAHRRYVASFADYYFLCGDQIRTITFLVKGEDSEPRTNVTMRTIDNALITVSFPFAIENGDTFAKLLAREGNREFYNPVSNERFTLRELYALAKVDPQAPIDSIDAAVAPLEGLRLRINDLRAMRMGLEGLLDTHGIERLDRTYMSAPSLARELQITDMKGIGKDSTLGKKLSGMTITDVATISRNDFITRMLEDVPNHARKATEQQASEIWSRATRIDNLSQAWQDI